MKKTAKFQKLSFHLVTNTLLVAAFSLAIFGSTIGILAAAQPDAGSNEAASAPLAIDELRLFAKVFGEIKTEYVVPVDDATVLTAAVRAMVSSLDPHSSYLDKTEYRELMNDMNGHFAGVGIAGSIEHGSIKVDSVINDTPAARAGIRPGDLITGVDQTTVQDATAEHVLHQMRGTAGTKVTLTISRTAIDRTFNVTLTRTNIKVKTVQVKILQPNYGYVRISAFQEMTVANLAAGLRDLARQQPGLKGLILDLRNNGGGLLQSAVGVASVFLPVNAVVVSTAGKMQESKHTFRAAYADYRVSEYSVDPLQKLPKLFKNVTLIVLTNAYSASASEIVAGALQDYHRARIFGKTTFGKGSVQTIYPITNDEAVRLTTAFYFTPNGTSIQNRGVHPDVLVDQYPDGDPGDLLATREVDYIDHLKNIQDQNKIIEEGQKPDRYENLQLRSESDEIKSTDLRLLDPDRESIEFGSANDYVLAEALHELTATSSARYR